MIDGSEAAEDEIVASRGGKNVVTMRRHQLAQIETVELPMRDLDELFALYDSSRDLSSLATFFAGTSISAGIAWVTLAADANVRAQVTCGSTAIGCAIGFLVCAYQAWAARKRAAKKRDAVLKDARLQEMDFVPQS